MIFTHGYQKIFLGGRIDGTAGWFTSMGMQGNGRMHAWMAALTETGTGVLMVLGCSHPFAAAGITGIMFVAFWTHRTKWFVFKEGVEYNVVVAVVVAAIATFSGGEWSLDHAIGLDRRAGGLDRHGHLGPGRHRRRRACNWPCSTDPDRRRPRPAEDRHDVGPASLRSSRSTRTGSRGLAVVRPPRRPGVRSRGGDRPLDRPGQVVTYVMVTTARRASTPWTRQRWARCDGTRRSVRRVSSAWTPSSSSGFPTG